MITRTKYLSLISAIFIALTALLSSCSGEKKYKIGVSQCSDDDWRQKMNREMTHELLIHPEAEMEIRSADDSSEKQIEDIDYFIKNHFDIIIAAPNEADALIPAIKRARKAGIPVLLFDRTINDSTFTAWRGADNEGIGRAAGRHALSITSSLGRPANVLEIYGRRGSSPAEGRSRGFRHVADSSRSLKIVAVADGLWDEAPAGRLADSILRLNPDIDLIYAHNDRMAIAASQAARHLGLHPKVIGIDAAPEIGIKAVSDGVIDASFLYPTEGNKTIRTALDILQGKTFRRTMTWPSAYPVTSANADLLLHQNESLKEEVDKMKNLQQELNLYWERHSAQTSLFYMLIAFLVLLGLFLFVMLRAFWTNKRHQAELELRAEQLRAEKEKQEELNIRLREEKEKQEELNLQLRAQKEKQEFLYDELNRATQSKLAFFTNVSHDLRTPLTLIQEPIEQVGNAGNLTSQQNILMRIAHKNVGILHRLINQILDFRKYENGLMSARYSHVDITTLIREWIASFDVLAGKRDIRLFLNMPEHPVMVDIDVEKIERIFFNLMSNAFKHTPANGSITFNLHEEADRIVFSVADTGEGMAADELPKIFDRFYQVDQVRPKGSGIGLALVKAFVELHGGTIAVESEPGRGSVFTVEIPIHADATLFPAPPSDAAPSEKEIAGETTPISLPDAIRAEVRDMEARMDEKVAEFDPEKPLTLLIEDNEDMRRMISTLLEDEYNVITAVDGREGLRLAARYVPDLIISDVMMPGMDGLECCHRLKSELSTSHIPVLLLTACSLDEQKTQGYDSGADGYVSKPFNIDVLKARLRSLIANRRRIRDVWNSQNAITINHGEEKPLPKRPPVTPSEAARPNLSPMDSEFYERFLAKVESSISNPDMNVDSLASELGLGRSQFYRKIKALTNYSPVELLRRMRLKRSRDLLTTTGMSISEIAYAVGFSNPAYFTKCFREAYGQTPTDLRESLYE